MTLRRRKHIYVFHWEAPFVYLLLNGWIWIIYIVYSFILKRLGSLSNMSMKYKDWLLGLSSPTGEGPESQWPSRLLTSRTWAKSSHGQAAKRFPQDVQHRNDWNEHPYPLSCGFVGSAILSYTKGFGMNEQVYLECIWLVTHDWNKAHDICNLIQMIRSCCFKSKSWSSFNIEALFCGSSAGKLWSYAVSMCVFVFVNVFLKTLDCDSMLTYWIVCLYGWVLRRVWNVKQMTTWILKGGYWYYNKQFDFIKIFPISFVYFCYGSISHHPIEWFASQRGQPSESQLLTRAQTRRGCWKTSYREKHALIKS